MERVELNEGQKRARRRRSFALALALCALVLLFYVATVVKFGPTILERTL